jgi:hypothetical protein
MAFEGRPAGARLADLQPTAAGGLHAPEVVVYENRNFDGAEWRTNLGWGYVGDFWNDKISSIIVVSGVWRFWQDAGLSGNHWDLGPGYYDWVVAAGIPNDIISSFQPISW